MSPENDQASELRTKVKKKKRRERGTYQLNMQTVEHVFCYFSRNQKRKLKTYNDASEKGKSRQREKKKKKEK